MWRERWMLILHEGSDQKRNLNEGVRENASAPDSPREQEEQAVETNREAQRDHADVIPDLPLRAFLQNFTPEEFSIQPSLPLRRSHLKHKDAQECLDVHLIEVMSTPGTSV